MIIDQITVKGFISSAIVTDEDGKQYTLHDNPYERKLEVCNYEDGATIESYDDFKAALNSHFLPGFMLMEDFKERYMRFIAIDIRDLLESSKKSFYSENGNRYATNEFKANGQERVAVVAKRGSGDISDCLYEIYDRDGNLMETYGLLSFALSSPYYPLLAELDSYIDEQEEEENE